MKKFSNINESVEIKKYKETIKNDLLSLIENTLSLKISNEDRINDDISINGKDELVEKINTLINNVKIKERTLTLETVKVNFHRNFDMNWISEQINGLNKIYNSKLKMNEYFSDPNSKTIYDDFINYFVKKLNEIKNIGNYQFNFEPSDGIFKFTNEDKGIIVKATPFYNDKNGIPIEVCDINNPDSHYFIEQRELNVEKKLYDEYLKIIIDFLVNEDWLDKIKKED